jgi:tryptophan halogenase
VSAKPQTVVIGGRDVAAWLSACALARAFGATGLKVELVELPSQLRPHDILASLPQLEPFHRLLGLNERDVLKQTHGVYSLGQSFVNFSGLRPPFFHPYGDHGRPFENLSFAQIWFKARAGGLKVAFEDFSPNAVAAKAGRFFNGGEIVQAFRKCNYAYHLHAASYVQVLKRLAQHLGVHVTTARRFEPVIDAESGRVAALEVEGRRIAGDVFVDATGAERQLVREAMGADFDDWSRWLPMTRLLTAAGPKVRVLSAYSQVRALEAGCLHLAALQTFTGASHAYNGDWLSDDMALEALAVTAGAGVQGATLSERRAGRCTAPWTRNCVAVGEAACSLDMIDNTDLHVLQIGLSHLISLFPLSADSGLEATVYNRRVGDAFDRLRDYQIAHYKLNGQIDHPFWDALRDMAVPDSLAEKLSLFKARGDILLYDDESFDRDDWLSLLIGHGLTPDAWDPRVDMAQQDKLIQHVQTLLGYISEQTQAMQSHDAYIEMFASPGFADYGSSL